MKPKNTLKFIVILVAVGFFGSILLSGSGSKNQASLSAPTPQLAAVAVNSGNNVAIGQTFINPVAVEGSDFQVHFKAPAGADWLDYSVCPVNSTGVASKTNCRIYMKQSEVFAIPVLDVYESGVYSVTASACVQGYCSTASKPIYIKVRERVTEKFKTTEEVPPYTFWIIDTMGIVHKWDRNGSAWTPIRPPVAEVVPLDVPIIPPEAPATGFVGELVGDVRNFFLRAQDFVAGVIDNIVQWFAGAKIGPPVQGIFNLTVVVNPSDTLGVVTDSNNLGINCGANNSGTCTASVTSGALVNLASNIKGTWSVAPSGPTLIGCASAGGNANCGFNMPGNALTVTATFPSPGDISITECNDDFDSGVLAIDITSPPKPPPIPTVTNSVTFAGKVTINPVVTLFSGVSYSAVLGYDSVPAPQSSGFPNSIVDTEPAQASDLSLSGTATLTNGYYWSGLRVTKHAGSTTTDCSVAMADGFLFIVGEPPTTAFITVQKVTIPSSHSQDFIFNLSGPLQQTTLGQFTLDTDGNSLPPSQQPTFSPLIPGTYTLTENPVPGWTTTVSCTGTGIVSTST